MSKYSGSQTWPSRSSKLRLNMKGRSCGGLTSTLPPCAPAASSIASTAWRLSTPSASDTSLVRASAIGLSVKVAHFACVSSIT